MIRKSKWKHRIDAVPEVGKRILFGYAVDGDHQEGLVVECPEGDTYYEGVADDVRIQLADGKLVIPTRSYSWWCYA